MSVPAAVLPELPKLPVALLRGGVSAGARRALRQLLEDFARVLEAVFDRGVEVRALLTLRAQAVERVLGHTWDAFVGKTDDAALFAVGGFGRGLLFPYSDIDLLVLSAPELPADRTRAIQAFFTCLWDLGLAPGQAVRTLAECRELAAADVSVFTSLLDARMLAGSAESEQALHDLIAAPGLWSPAAFLAAKRAEQQARHARLGDTAYSLEPNLKDGPGGLRSLDLMRWLARRVAGAADLAATVDLDLLDATELAALERSELELQRDRYALHRIAGRPEERLLFEHQRAIAALLGFEDRGQVNFGVEQFMQGYYRAATVVERLCAQFEERLAELLEPAPVATRPLDADFCAEGSRIAPREAGLFRREPRTLIEIFAALLDHPELDGLSARTMRLVQQALAAHGDAFAADPGALQAFLALLRRGAPAVEALVHMNRHGVLAALIPAFRRVVGRMQYDLFHAYTVDEHSVRVLRHIARFGEPEAAALGSEAGAIFSRLDKPELLLLAGLFHDIAKGRGGDHAVLGEAEARDFGQRLGLAGEDVELVAWLVRWHLLMSVTAQRQDITDPEVVHRFAAQAGERERLDYLYLLTIADIAGTNPRLWNGWKARLLADLHTAARYMLRAGLGKPPQAGARIETCREASRERMVAAGRDPGQAAAILERFPRGSFLRHRPEQIAWQAGVIARAVGDPVVAVRAHSARGGSSELFVSTADRDGLFASITAALDRFGCSVVEARLFVTAERRIFDTFQLLDAASQAPLTAERAPALEDLLRRVLAAPELDPKPVRRGLSRRQRHFQIAPQLAFSEVDGRTQMALICSDRPGLLAEAALAMREAHVRVHDARIATYGERAEDFFILSDENDAALDAAARERLQSALLRRLGVQTIPRRGPDVP